MIRRQPAAAQEPYDLIVVGGGVYGIALTLEASRRGWRTLLLERGDFGGETSANSLGIIHGGLRYLQSLDLERFRESVAERRWFLEHFPDLVEPLECLMPLYGRGLRRRSVLAAALRLDDLLSSRRNRGLRADRSIPRGRTVSAPVVESICPYVRRAGLTGGALWSDGVITSVPRLFLEMLRWAASNGAECVNYADVEAPLLDSERICGVRARDRVDGALHEYRGATVVNCAGPWCLEVATRLDPRQAEGSAGRSRADLFHSSIACNVALEVADPKLAAWAAGDVPALAISPPRSSKSYFLRPASSGLIAGTYHMPWRGPAPSEAPEEMIETFLDDLGQCLPGLLPEGNRNADRVVRVDWGILPAVRQGSATQAKRPVVHEHGRDGGPSGLFSVSGVKLTTARRVAEQTVRAIANQRHVPMPELGGSARPAARSIAPVAKLQAMLRGAPSEVVALARELAREESVVYLDDLLLRRTDWGADPRLRETLRSGLGRLLGAREDGFINPPTKRGREHVAE